MKKIQGKKDYSVTARVNKEIYQKIKEAGFSAQKILDNWIIENVNQEIEKTISIKGSENDEVA